MLEPLVDNHIILYHLGLYAVDIDVDELTRVGLFITFGDTIK